MLLLLFRAKLANQSATLLPFPLTCYSHVVVLSSPILITLLTFNNHYRYSSTPPTRTLFPFALSISFVHPEKLLRTLKILNKNILISFQI